MTYSECIQHAQSTFKNDIYRSSMVYYLIGKSDLPRYQLTVSKNLKSHLKCFKYDKFVEAFRESKKIFHKESITTICDQWYSPLFTFRDFNFDRDTISTVCLYENKKLIYESKDLLDLNIKEIHKHIF